MKSLIETVNRYKTKSVGPIVDQQVAYIPRLEKYQIDYITFYYILDGKRVPANITNQLFIKLKFLHFRSIPIRKFLQYRSGVFSMNNLVDKQVIMPFMLFINGIFIPWEYIDIVIDNDNYHIIINGNDNEHIIELCKNCDFVQIVTLPEYCICIKDYVDNPLNTMFVFNEFGKFDIDNPKYYIVSSTNFYSLGFNYWHTNQSVNAFKLLNQKDIKLTKLNIMLFVNGIFSTGVREKTPRGTSREYEDDNGNIKYRIDFTYSPNSITPNPEIKMNSTLITINGGKNDEADIYDFGLFVNPNYTASIDNISRVDTDQLATMIREANNTGIMPRHLFRLNLSFRMKMNINKMYSENLANALKIISKYNTDLFKPIFRDRSNLVIEEHNYEWIQAHIKGGAIILPVSYNNEYIVVLVNGRLYEYSHMIKYYTNKIIIPIQNIGPNDIIEFLRFKNINNMEKKVIINEDDGFVNYSEEYINENMCLFTTEYNTELDSYDFPEGGRQHFEIEYTLEKNDNGLTKIVFANPYYYGKELVMTYRDRFKWEVFTVENTDGMTEFVLDLGDRFKYCNQYHRFLVFLNNTRLSSDHFRLTLPTRPTTPFTNFKIYLTIPVSEGDRLDILYTPALFQDVIVRDTIDVSGDIVIDKSVLDYGLSTDLYMVWINGKKVARSNISDIDTTHIRVTSDEKSTNVLCITKYIPSIEVINDVFDSNTALWDIITSALSADDINNLLGIKTNTITDIEPNRYEDAANIKAIMNELIRDEFLTNPSIDVTGPFVYDYLDVDTTIVSGYDSDENATLETADANHDNNLAILNRDYP